MVYYELFELKSRVVIERRRMNINFNTLNIIYMRKSLNQVSLSRTVPTLKVILLINLNIKYNFQLVRYR